MKNIYDHSEKVFKEAMRSQYEMHRRGVFNYPSIEEWLAQEWRRFCLNNPDLVGLTYDEENKDWVHKYEGGLIRVIL